mgnify:FL=1
MKLKQNLNKFKWNIKNLYLKNEHKIIPILNFIKYILISAFILFSYMYILYILNIISIKKNIFIKFNSIEFKDVYKDLVIAQISSTFLTTAVLSLIASIENKHILGEKETDLLFGTKIQGFYIPMFILYITMVINITLMINKTFGNILIMLFLLSIYTLIYIVNKIGVIFLTTKKYKRILYYKYYNEAQHNIINNIPPRTYEKKLLFKLKDETIGLIAKNNLGYMENMNMYQVVIDRLLFNIPQDIQKYHLNMNYAPSIINDFIEIIEHFLYFDETIRAIQFYNWLLSRLNFHNIYIPYNNIDYIFDDLINKITDLKNEYEVKKYLTRLASIITNIEIQEHYALTTDFSYTGLSQTELGYIYHHNSKYFEKIYDKVYTNKYLSNSEKINCYTELYETFRMSAHNGCNIIRDITNYSFDFKKPKERNIPPCIVGQATALLLLRTLKNKDERAFKLFIGMNIDGNEMSFAIHCLLLSLINIKMNKMDENIYSEYYGINPAYCKKIIRKNLDKIFTQMKLWKKDKLIDQLQYDYDYIIKNCVEESRDKLFLEYIFKFDKALINQYFMKLSKRYNKEIKIQKYKEKNYKNMINEYIIDTIIEK